MDRPIPKEEIRARLRKRWIYIGVAAAVIIGAIVLVTSLARSSVKRSELILARATFGTIETSVGASGRVVPAFEEVITSPISSRIMEVYLKAGDTVSEGTPIVRLDLTSTRADLEKLQDQQGMKNLEREQLKLSSTTALTNLEMQIKVKEMEVSQLAQEVANEVYLDSLGTGTGDRVREARLKHSTASLQLEQLRRQLQNERNSVRASLDAKDLDISISRKNLDLQANVLRDAEIRASRHATITVIPAEIRIGQPVSQGAQVATIADLDHFKVEASVAENQMDKVRPGSKAVVKVGKNKFPGIVTNVSPQSAGGNVSFDVALDEDFNPSLRSGLKADVFVIWDVIEDVVRIPLIPAYTGPGIYDIFVVSAGGEELERRTVNLGDCNYDWVEVKSGIRDGEEVVVNNMSRYNSNLTLRLK